MKKFLLLFFALFAMTFFAKAQTPILSEDFENGLPTGWTQIDANNDNYVWEHSSNPVSYHNSGVNLAGTGHNGSDGYVLSGSYSNASGQAITPDNWLITPSITLNGAATLSFWVCSQDASYSAEHYGVYISTTDNTNTSAFTLLQEWTIGQSREQTAWENHTVNLSAYNGETVYIAFRHFNCNDEFILNLDDVTITVLTNDPTIVANPTSLTMPTLLGLPASATVQIDGYNLTSTITASTNAPFEVSSDGTNFGATASLAQAGGTLYVKYTPTAAGTDNETITLTSGSATASITLTGTAVDCNITLPYTETFETTSPYLNCWTMAGDYTWSIGTGDYSTSTGAYAGSYNALITHSSSGNVTKLISPILDGVTDGLALEFAYVMRSWAGDIDELRVYIRTDANSTWQQVAEYTDAAASWTVENIFISGPVYQVAFEHTDNYGYGIGLDNVSFTAMTPDFCYPVTNLTASGVTAHEATLTWSGDANNYDIYDLYDTTIVTTVNDTTYTLTGLTSDTQHNFGVVANCTSSSSTMVAVSFHTLISCPVPTGLEVVLTPGDGTVATLNWHENGTATEWQICLDGDETNLIDVTDTTYDFIGLTAEQIYTAKVRAICDVNDHSAWSSNISFQPTTKTVIGSGNTTNSYLPTYSLYNYSLTQQIFTVAEVGDAGLIESIDFYNNSSSSLTRDLSIYVVSTTKDTFASATDWISVTAADLQHSGNVTFAPQAWTTINLSGFVYDGLSNIAIIVDDNTGSYVGGTPFKVFNANSQALRVYSDPTNYEVTAPTYEGTIMNVKNQIRLAKGSLDGCLRPTSVTVNYTGGDEAEVSWNSDAATVNINVNGTVTNNVTSPYTLTGLDLATTYTIMLQAECSSTSISDWTNPISFTTDACLAENQCTISIVGVDSWGDGWNGNAINIIQNGVTVGTFTLPTSTSSLTGTFNVCSGIPVSFSWTTGSYADETSFEIFDGGNTSVYTVADGSSLTDGVFFTLNSACPSCMPASALTVDNATETSITISWTGTAPSYDIYNGENFETNVTTNTYTFTGLTTATNYTFGVQAICSADDSASVVTINVTTSCSSVAINLPFTETFDLTSGTRDCWTTIDADNDGFGWTTLQDGTGADLESMNSYSYDNGTYTALNPDNWLISPKLHSNTGSPVTMQWTVASAPSYPAEHYGVYVSTTTNNNTANFTMIDEWTISDGNAEVKTLDLSAYAGQDIYVAFRHHNCTDQYILRIDDVQLYEGTYVPDTLTVTFAVNNATMGTTNPVPGTYQYVDGETVNFSAVPNAGYHFVTWEYALGSSTEVHTFDSQSAYFNASSFMNYGNVSFTAIFEAGNPDSTTITYTVNDPTMGTTTPAPGTYTIYVGDNIQAAATANAGYELTTWILDYTLSGTVTNIATITSDSADFANPITFGTVPQSFADYGATFTVTAVFAPSTIPPTTYTVTLNTADASMGTVSPAGQSTVEENSSFTATATAADGYHFENWVDDNGNTFSYNPYTFTVTGNTTLTAVFAANDPGITYYNVTVASANTQMGNVSSTHSGQVAENTEVTATATALDGYRFVNWTNDAGTEVSTANPYTFTVTADVVLIANFEVEDGIDAITLSQSINLMPNPADNYIELRVNSNVEVKEAVVYNAFGQMIQTIQLNDNHARIDLSNVASGMYFVRVNGEGVSAVKKFIKR